MNLFSLTTIGLAVALLSVASNASAQDFVSNRRYDQYTYLSTHNAFANNQQQYRLTTANQTLSIANQAKLGVRCFMLDIYLVRQYQDDNAIWHYRAYGSPAEAAEEKEFRWQNLPLDIVVAHNPGSDVAGYRLLSGYPFTPKFRPLTGDLQMIEDAMKAYPNDIFTIVFESYVNSTTALTAFPPELRNWVFYANKANSNFPAPTGANGWHVKYHGWPTVKDMRDNQRRLVVFSGNGGNSETSDDGFAFQFKHMVENVYGDESAYNKDVPYWAPRSESNLLDDFSIRLFAWNCFPTYNAVGPNYSLGLVNPDTGTHNYSVLNSTGRLLQRALGLQQAGKRLPNFLNVDFFETGDNSQGGTGGPAEVVDMLNRGWASDPVVETNLEVLPKPNKYGWLNTSADVVIRGDLRFPTAAITATSLRSDGVFTTPVQAYDRNSLIFPVGSDGVSTVSGETVSWIANANPVGRTVRSNAQYITVRIDRSPPFSTAQTVGRAIRVTATDGASGVDFISYQVNDGPIKQAPNDSLIPLGERGLVTVRFWATDKAGNVEQTRTTSLSIPADVSSQIAVTRGGLRYDRFSESYFQTITFKNNGTAVTQARAALSLSTSTLRSNYSGVTAIEVPLGSPYVTLGSMDAGATKTITLQYKVNLREITNYAIRIFAGTGGI